MATDRPGREDIGEHPARWGHRRHPPTLPDLARAGLLWTGAQHEALRTPPPAAVTRRLALLRAAE